MRDPRNANAFSSCGVSWGSIFNSSGISGTGETPQTQSVEEAHRLPRGSLSSLERKSTDNIEG